MLRATYEELSNAIRSLSLDAIEKSKSGHIGICLGMADVVTVLFKDFLKFSSKNPVWTDRDRFVLSAGHGSMLLYSLLYFTGYGDISIDDIKNFRQLGYKTAGHPEHDLLQGVEATTGPLGQGLANGVGMALAEKILAAKFPALVNHRTFVLVSDGDLMEGISQEAISFAGHHKLDKLILLFDSNKITIDGNTTLSISDDVAKRFEACNWDVFETDGHDTEEIKIAIQAACDSKKPSLIICNTVIGYGAKAAGKAEMHSAVLTKEDVEFAKSSLNCKYEPFETPANILSAWRAIGDRGLRELELWQERLNQTSAEEQEEFRRIHSQEMKKNINEVFLNLKQQMLLQQNPEATRKASGSVLERLASKLPELVGGSSDLTESNYTKTSSMEPVLESVFHKSRYIYYGVREHAMSAIMNGISLHKGMVPYGGTFLVFSDYARPAIRLSALMKQKVIYIFTHDSIGVGEDGPTHQPIEHLDSLRLIPNLQVMRPCDAYETVECWQMALEYAGPSAICLTRQKISAVTKNFSARNNSSYGAYIISAERERVDAVVIASGSEVEIAIAAQAELQKQNIDVRVVSAPCINTFYAQDEDYKREVIGVNKNIIAIEASTALSFYRITPHVISLNSFGSSAKYQDLFKHFCITKEKIILKVKTLL